MSILVRAVGFMAAATVVYVIVVSLVRDLPLATVLHRACFFGLGVGTSTVVIGWFMRSSRHC